MFCEFIILSTSWSPGIESQAVGCAGCFLFLAWEEALYLQGLQVPWRRPTTEPDQQRPAAGFHCFGWLAHRSPAINGRE